MKKTTASSPRLLVVGPGALGCLFAARLGRRWPGTYLLDHRSDRAARLQEEGLHVSGASMLDWSPPSGRVRVSAAGWPLMDVVLLFVKSPTVSAALRAAAPALGPRTSVVVFPETVDAGRLGIPASRVMAALTEDRARLEGPGRVFHEASGEASLDAGRPSAPEVAGFLRQAGVTVRLDRAVGEKRRLTRLAQICLDVPSALIDAPQRRVLEGPLRSAAEALLEEVSLLSRAEGRAVSPSSLRARRAALVSRAPEAGSPLGRDLLRGGPTEREALLGPLLSFAGKKKIAAPVLTAFNLLLKRLERKRL